MTLTDDERVMMTAINQTRKTELDFPTYNRYMELGFAGRFELFLALKGRGLARKGEDGQYVLTEQGLALLTPKNRVRVLTRRAK